MRKYIIAACLLVSFLTACHRQVPTVKVFPEDLLGTCEKEEDPPVEKCNLPKDSTASEEESEEAMAETAVKLCFPDSKPHFKEIDNALTLLKVEDEMNVPRSIRGLTLASACIESGFNEKALGDQKFSKDKKTPMAVGILQMWPWYEKTYQADRRNVRSSAKAWIAHIESIKSNVNKHCHPKNLDEEWKLALVHGIRAPKKGGRCTENTTHWVLFKKMRHQFATKI